MAGDADMADAVLLDQAALENFDRRREIAHRIVDTAADAQHLFDAAAGGEGCQQLVKLVGIAKRARRQMRHRAHAVIMQSFGNGDGVARVGSGKKGHIDRCPGRQTLAETLDLGCPGRGYLDRPVCCGAPDGLNAQRHKLHLFSAKAARQFPCAGSMAIPPNPRWFDDAPLSSGCDMRHPQSNQPGSRPPLSTSDLTLSAGYSASSAAARWAASASRSSPHSTGSPRRHSAR